MIFSTSSWLKTSNHECQDVMEDASRLDEPMSSSFVFEQLVFQAEVAEARPASFKYAKCVLDPDTRCSCFTIKRGLQDQRSSLKLVLTGPPYRSASPLRRVNMVMRSIEEFLVAALVQTNFGKKDDLRRVQVKPESPRTYFPLSSNRLDRYGVALTSEHACRWRMR